MVARQNYTIEVVVPNMKTSDKLIEEVIRQSVGVEIVPLVRYLRNRKNVSEFKIAEGIKQEVNITRNWLYRLYDLNLVTFIRKKDKIKGWYIYYWTFNPGRVRDLQIDLRRKRLEKLKDRLKRERGSDFFICENKCIRLDFDQVTESAYKCPEFGTLMHQEDNAEHILSIEKEIQALEKALQS